MIFDPFTGNLDGTGRSVFSSNGRHQRDPRFAAEPRHDEAAGAGSSSPISPAIVNNYFNSGTQRLNRNNVDAKINWNRNEKHQIWGKYSIMNALVHGDFGLGEAGGGCLCDGGVGDGHTLVQIAAIGQTYTVSPTFLIDGTLGWTRFGQNVKSPDLGTNFGSDTLGIPGTNGPDPRESGMPAFNIGSDYSTLGQHGRMESAVPQRPVLHLQRQCKLDEGRARDPVWFRLHAPSHEPLAAGAGRRVRAARSVSIHGVTALNPAALGSSVGFQGGTPSFENGWNGLAGFLLGTPDVLREEQPVHQDEQSGEPVRSLRSRPLARHLQADPQSGIAVGAVPQPDALRRHGHRIV